MAFIGLLFATFAFFILLIGLILFISALILDLICIIRGLSKKKNHIVLIIVTVIVNVAGFVMFVLPVGGFIILNRLDAIEKQKHFDNTEYKVYVEEGQAWRNGFEYKGMELINLDFLNSPKKDLLKEEGVIREDNRNYYISYVHNAGNFEIYYVEIINDGLFCKKEQYEDIKEYYTSANNLKSVITINTDEDSKTYDTDIQLANAIKIRELYDTHGDGLCYGKYTDLEDDFYVKTTSDDGLMYEIANIGEYDGRMILMWTSSGGSFSAIYLTKELETDLKEAINTIRSAP